MKATLFIAICIQLAFAYHDPDLNYHLSQVQKVSNCDQGYSYLPPAVQLTTTGIKTAAPAIISQQVQAPAYQYSGQAGYSSGASYQSVAPQITYATQPAATYQTSSIASNYASSPYQTSSIASNYASSPYQTSSIASNYASSQGYASEEVHGYATSAGLSAVASNSKTVTPLATYAQAPIIAKVTAAPLIAKFSVSQPKISYASQNLVQQAAYSGSYAKASLNSYSSVQSGGPVVSQVYAAPSSGYATSPALRVQQPSQYAAPVQYSSSISAPTVAQYHQVQHVSPAVSQYSSNSISHGSSSAAASQYFLPAVSQNAGANYAQYSAPVVTQHTAPAVAQYASPVVSHYQSPTVVQHSAPAVQYSAPAVIQHSSPAVIQHSAPTFVHHSAPAVQYSAPAVVHHSAPAVTQYAAPAVAHYSSPAVASHVTQYASAPVSVSHVSASAVAVAPVTKIAANVAGKNVHREFLENYDAHPRYAFEYSVNDPHTGDIKQQKEERDGEVVKGQYSLVEPDGSVRTVNYVADWETGFHADVRNSKDNQH